MNQNNNKNCNVPKSVSTNKVNYPMSNKMWFNQRGGDIYRTVYVGDQKKYVVDKMQWNRLNTKK
jgi:hypothetical protein